MKAALVFLGLCALAYATPVKKIYDHHEYKVADKEWLTKQYEILRLFNHVQQPSYYKDYVKVAEELNHEPHWDWYTKPEEVKEFWWYYKHKNILPQGEIFSVFHQDHLKEAISLFKLFYYAKNWECFWKTAVWARQHVNEGMYVYALSVAIVHRPDTEKFLLPPIHEVYPYFFFPSETIHEAQKWKQSWPGTYEESSSYKGYTVYSNYSGWYMNHHPEQYLSYFTEDVGINAFYFYYNLYYPFWMSSQEFHIVNPHRGEQFYYIHQQILARYYLERLSNDMGEIPYFDWEYPIETGYYPSLQYPNGLEFPYRPSEVHLYDKHHDGHQSHTFYYKNYTWSHTLIQDYERRIRDAIDQGFVWTTEGQKIDLYSKEGFETLGDLIESNPDSPNSRFYGALQVFARYFLGYSHTPLDKYKIAPSVLEHFETSLRDPVFYQFWKRIVLYFQKYKSHLQPYKYEDLYFPGVKVVKAEFDELVTYFDKYYSDLSNAVYVTEKEFVEDTVHVRAVQDRLNHKPFTYKLWVNSEKQVESMVRVFIGPKYDEYGRYLNITWNRMNFVEFDRFTYKLKVGENVIERNSYDNWYAHDWETYEHMFDEISAAMEGKKEYHIYDHDYYYGFPSRFLLPKGTESGMEYQFYFLVTPYEPVKVDDSHAEWYWPVGFEHEYLDGHAYGYPFDRPIWHEWWFHVPNSYFHEVEIFHKEHENVTPVHH